MLFPNILVVGSENAPNFQFRVPVDDTHTLHIFYTVHTARTLACRSIHSSRVPVVFSVPLPDVDETGAQTWQWLEDSTWPGHDGVVDAGARSTRRDLQRLGVSDEGITLFRKQLEDNIDKVQRGEESR